MSRDELIAFLKEKLSVAVYVDGGGYCFPNARTVRVKTKIILDGEVISEDSDKATLD